MSSKTILLTLVPLVLAIAPVAGEESKIPGTPCKLIPGTQKFCVKLEEEKKQPFADDPRKNFYKLVFSYDSACPGSVSIQAVDTAGVLHESGLSGDHKPDITCSDDVAKPCAGFVSWKERNCGR